MRPPEAMIECGHNEKADECGRGEIHDDSLSRLLLGGRPSPQPSFQQLRILFHEVKREGETRCEIDGEESPRLPIVEGARRAEQQRRHHEQDKQHSAERSLMQAVHAPIFNTAPETFQLPLILNRGVGKKSLAMKPALLPRRWPSTRPIPIMSGVGHSKGRLGAWGGEGLVFLPKRSGA